MLIPFETSSVFSPKGDLDLAKAQLLHWAAQFPYCAYLDSCQQPIDRYGRYEVLIGISRGSGVIRNWEALLETESQWRMGIFPYELKNRFEPSLHTRKPALTSFPEVAMFVPETMIYLEKGSCDWKISGSGPRPDMSLMQAPTWRLGEAPQFEALVTEATYLKNIQQVQADIRAGDYYELNLAQAFVAQHKLPQPAAVFQHLTSLSPVPFGAFVRFGDLYLLCASPERFLQMQGDRLLSQPIKGTAPRSDDPLEDQAHHDYLMHSLKEQAENVMIVDLTRNDLYRCSLPHSVGVPHLFEIQPFAQVYQMVSTITGMKQPGMAWHEVLARTFPPGSMTGAPKVMCMDRIDAYEPCARGAYAGSVGYVAPSGDFDLNVIIRSLIYDAGHSQLSYHVGGAITLDSDPRAEYAETLLKAAAIRKLWLRVPFDIQPIPPTESCISPNENSSLNLGFSWFSLRNT